MTDSAAPGTTAMTIGANWRRREGSLTERNEKRKKDPEARWINFKGHRLSEEKPLCQERERCIRQPGPERIVPLLQCSEVDGFKSVPIPSLSFQHLGPNTVAPQRQ